VGERHEPIEGRSHLRRRFRRTPVSIKSAREIEQNLDPEKYEPFWIAITSGGDWKLCDGPRAAWENGSGRAVTLSPDRSVHGLLVREQDGYQTVRLDVVLPMLHGKLCEDGAIQGLLELSGIPYLGCDIQSSVVCMDKSLTYTVAQSAGIATPNYWAIGENECVTPTSCLIPSS
jgi:D-alanine---(R)-lactate ligase